jgi:dipeptidyl aminopeptidase/acylaminoacyl peptidase
MRSCRRRGNSGVRRRIEREQARRLDRTGRTRRHRRAGPPAQSRLLPGSQAAHGEQRRRSTGVWVVDLERGAPTRFVPYGTSPWISPDGQRIVFTSDRLGGVSDMFARSTAGRNDEEVVLRTPRTRSSTTGRPTDATSCIEHESGDEEGHVPAAPVWRSKAGAVLQPRPTRFKDGVA